MRGSRQYPASAGSSSGNPAGEVASGDEVTVPEVITGVLTVPKVITVVLIIIY